MDNEDLPYSLMAELDKVGGSDNPPVHLWHPDNEKDIDLTITKTGVWNYLGTPIKRPRLVRLFASVLRKDLNEYFLVTPVEKCRITVEDVPFQIILMDVKGEGEQQEITLTSDMGESFALDADHGLRILRSGEETIPYLHVRGDMDGRVNRNVYYQMAELLQQRNDSGQEWLGLWSHGQFFRFIPA